MNRIALLVSAALVLGGGGTASAQELNLATTGPDRPSVVQVRTGVDHALIGELGYLRVVGVGARQILVGGDVAMPWAKPDLRDYRVRATVGAPIGTEHWKLVGWLSPTLRGTENAASDMAAVGADVRLAGGYYARRWFLAGEAGLDWVAATHIAFRDRYRSLVYSGARDGWYRAPGGTAYTGLHGGVSFSSFDLVLRVGQPRSTALEMQTLPLYVTVGVNVPLAR